jgi:ribosomal protein L11 methyltransferase
LKLEAATNNLEVEALVLMLLNSFIMASYYSRLQVICDPEFSELLMAEIGDIGFESFLETDKGFEAYVELENYDKNQLQVIKDKYSRQTKVIFYQDRIQKQNWNEEWEKSYQPIIVDGKCQS